MKPSRKGCGHRPSLDHCSKGHCLQGQGMAVTGTTLVLLPGPSPPLFHETPPCDFTNISLWLGHSGSDSLAGVTPASPTCPRQQGPTWSMDVQLELPWPGRFLPH